MQKKHAKGFFINSSYRRKRALKVLLRGLGYSHDDPDNGEDGPDGHQPGNDPGDKGAWSNDKKGMMKKVVRV